MSKIASQILMVRPASFRYNVQTAANNVFQNKLKKFSQQEVLNLAVKEFDGFVAALRKKNIDVIVIEDSPEPPKPDAVFPNNWFCTLQDGTVAVFPMFAANRRIEKSDELLQTLVEKYNVKDVEDWSEYEAENLFLEGTGSMIFDHDHKIIYACLSPRTNKFVLQKFALAHGYNPFTFHAKDENGVDIYHTNVIMHLGDSYAIICLESVSNEAERIALSQKLISTGHEVISISLKQVYAFAGNMLQIKNNHNEKFTILSRSAFRSLTAGQKQALQYHTQLLPVNIPVIETVGGGGVRCMMAEIYLQQKAGLN